MMKMKRAAIAAAVMIGSMALPAVTAFAQGTDPETVITAEAAAETEGSIDLGSIDLASLDLPGISGVDTDVYKDILSELDPEVLEVLLKNPKLLSYFLPTLHVTVTDYSVTIGVDGEVPEADPVQTGRVRTGGGSLNVRTGPGVGYGIIDKLSNGTRVEIAKEENGWYQLTYPAEYGYVCGKYLELNDITPKETPEGYTFDIDGEMLANFLSVFSGLFEEEPEPVPADPVGLTPDGNLTLVDDIGPVTGVGQQFLTMVSKNGNYFYMVIDRNEKGEENVHLLNLVDERDLMDLMAKDDKGSYEAITEAEKAAAEAKAQAEKEAAEKAAAEAKEKEKQEKAGKGKVNLFPILLVIPILAAAGGAWFYLQTKKKKQVSNTPDPDAGYSEDDDDGEVDYGAVEEGDAGTESDAPGDDGDPYEDDVLNDDDPGEPDETEEL